MKIHHLRNATLAIETAKEVILVDPMLGAKGSMPTLTLFRFKAKRNPIVPFPKSGEAILDRVTHCLITHLHPDHLDTAGKKFLKERNIPVTCSKKDETALKKEGLNVVQAIDYWKKSDFLGGSIEGIPALHGYGFIAKPMGNVMGFYLELPNEKSIYISSDTIYTDAVHKTLTSYQPEISIVAAGSAQLDIFQPLLMKMDDIVKFVKNSPHQVIANHLEAVNHCPTTREGLKQRLEKEGLAHKVVIPADGEVVNI